MALAALARRAPSSALALACLLAAAASLLLLLSSLGAAREPGSLSEPPSPTARAARRRVATASAAAAAAQVVAEGGASSRAAPAAASPAAPPATWGDDAARFHGCPPVMHGNAGAVRHAFLGDDTAAGAARARADTRGCGLVFYERIVLHAPFAACSSEQLFRAVSSGWRECADGPFHVRGCRVQWFTPGEACDLLARAGSLVLRGDSLVRHLTQALLTVLVGDYERATDLKRNTSDPGYHPCTCMHAYNDGHVMTGFAGGAGSAENRYCRGHSIATLRHRGASGPAYCPRWTAPHLNSYRAAAGIAYVSGGLHFPSLDAATVEAVFGAAARARTVPRTFSRLCGLMHAPGANKPVEYLRSHGLDNTTRFNRMIVERGCRAAGDFHFNPFAVTRNATSIDGQHYDHEANVVLAQLLLNHVAAIAGG